MKAETYCRVYHAVYSRRWLAGLLFAVSLAASLAVAVIFCVMLTITFMGEAIVAVRLIAVTAVPFLLVTLVRHVINAPRPYEVLEAPELDGLRKRGRVGHSFPSRHVASAMIIGGGLMPLSVTLGVLCLVFGVMLGACRVLSGRHFLRDVLAGGAIGIVSGVVGALIVNI